MKGVSVDAGDPHLLYKRLAEKLGFLSEIVVRQAFISIYDEQNAKELQSVIVAIDPTQAVAA